MIQRRHHTKVVNVTTLNFDYNSKPFRNSKETEGFVFRCACLNQMFYTHVFT